MKKEKEEEKFLKIIFRRKNDGRKVIVEGLLIKQTKSLLIIRSNSKITLNSEGQYEKVDLGAREVKIFPSEVEKEIILESTNSKTGNWDDGGY